MLPRVLPYCAGVWLPESGVAAEPLVSGKAPSLKLELRNAAHRFVVEPNAPAGAAAVSGEEGSLPIA
ncbi:MAG: hypothetical protein JWQ17_5477 [Tardiphaga sp.]|nr:hypothetical protein [Tardiphaga sp.]